MEQSQYSSRFEKGQTLIEVLVAFAVALIVVSAVTKVILSSLSTSIFTKNQNLAKQYSQQGIEVVRSMRDTSYASYKVLGNVSGITYCLAKTCPLLTTNPADTSCGPLSGATCGPNIDSTFVRQVVITTAAGNCNNGTAVTKVSVSTSWSDGACPQSNPYCHTEVQNSCLSDVNVLPTP